MNRTRDPCNEDKTMNKERTLYLTNRWTTTLFGYYFVVLIIGIFLAVLALLPDIVYEKEKSVLHLAIVGSVGMAANGAAIFYIRKLYKLCFADSLNTVGGENTYARRLGTIVYFIGRPLFSIGFSILVVIGLRSGFLLTLEGPAELNDGFIYMAMFFSFFVGFLSGRFVKQLEQSGERVIENAVKK